MSTQPNVQTQETFNNAPSSSLRSAQTEPATKTAPLSGQAVAKAASDFGEPATKTEIAPKEPVAQSRPSSDEPPAQNSPASPKAPTDAQPATTEESAENQTPLEPVTVQRSPTPLLLRPVHTEELIQRGDRVGSFTLITVVGEGTSGNVWKARHNTSSGFVAVKIITSPSIDSNPKRCLLLSHMVRDLAPAALSYLCVAEEIAMLKGHECVVTRLYATDLAALISNERLFPLPKIHATAMIWQLLKGLYYLHALGITHGDIKPGNILLKDSTTYNTRQLGTDGRFYSKEILQSPEIIICDLDDARLPLQPAYHPAGTPSYRAPEMVECLEWDSKVDVFAAACVAFELITRRQLFPEQRLFSPNQSEQIQISSPETKWSLVPDAAALDMIQSSTDRAPRNRPTAKSLLGHGFFGPLAHLHAQ